MFTFISTTYIKIIKNVRNNTNKLLQANVVFKKQDTFATIHFSRRACHFFYIFTKYTLLVVQIQIICCKLMLYFKNQDAFAIVLLSQTFHFDGMSPF